MNKKEAIQEFQCAGCANGEYPSCFKKSYVEGAECSAHCPGTICFPVVGRIVSGMPKGFNRVNENPCKVHIFETRKDQEREWAYDMFNVAVWKYTQGTVTFVRGFSPRTNTTWIHVILKGGQAVEARYELSAGDIDKMD